LCGAFRKLKPSNECESSHFKSKNDTETLIFLFFNLKLSFWVKKRLLSQHLAPSKLTFFYKPKDGPFSMKKGLQQFEFITELLIAANPSKI